ncbi:spermatogenesis-associated protein 2-like protein [Apteryx rowi]|uniref:spermatogenesis-associated protein 2-like protein n=1 Tax=Apteryx rowi TaxID=308060 RepID=UPI000E1DDF68|nr:spermatogenesis-associated protein 2-like protein [Apteryx rowi]XP_025940635.1 spermatogenesis-associated protein 2-like protein [Apteryx rowi]
MCSGAALRQEYRRCLERDFRRGRAGTCSDASFGETLRQRLRDDPALLRALQDDAGALLASGLRGRSDLGQALRGLAAAFEVLELAAVNLYLFPWRKEFGTIKTFSGAYVHWLRAALPEAELARSFARLGYVRRDEHHLTVSRPPPGPELVAAACGFFACRLECEILAEAVLRLRPCRVCAQDLLEARRLAGGAEACVEALRRLALRRDAGASCGDCVDLYREPPAGPEDAGPTGGRQDAAPSPLPGSSPRKQRARLWREPAGPRGAQDVPRRGWDLTGHGELGQELLPAEGNANPDTSLLFLEQELGAAGGSHDAMATGSGSPQVSSRCCPPAPTLSRAANHPVLGPGSGAAPGEPQQPLASGRPGDLPPTALRPASRGEAPELPCYQLHSCLRRGTLPSYCCTTCQQLHAGACAAVQACRTHHRGQELRSEKQQRLWLQRTEVDMLLADGSGARP